MCGKGTQDAPGCLQKCHQRRMDTGDGVKDGCTREIHEDSEALGLVWRCDW